MIVDIATAMSLVHRYYEYAVYVSRFGEEQYENPEHGIILADWNIVPNYIMEGLERRGFGVEFDDEWVCGGSDDNGPIIYNRAHAGSAFLLNDWTNGEVVPAKDIEEDPAAYVEEYLLNDTEVADQFDIEFINMGFTQLDKQGEVSMYRHPDVTPTDLVHELRKTQPRADYLFQVSDSNNPFSCLFVLWYREESK